MSVRFDTHIQKFILDRNMFESNDKMDALNRAKHGISFDEAQAIFQGPFLIRERRRRDHGETRFLSMGSSSGVVLIVVGNRNRQGRIRIISARKANSAEKKIYHRRCKEKDE